MNKSAAMETSTQDPQRRQRQRLLLWLIAGGIVIRFSYFVELAGSAFFRVPLLDAAFYDSVARALALSQDVQSINPAFRPLLYPAFLSLFYRIGDAGPTLALGAQFLLGILTAVAIALVATRLFGKVSAGAAAGGLYLLAGPPLYFEGELLVTTLFTALGALLLLHLATVRADSPLWRWLLAGVWVGLMASARANALILGLAFPIAALLLPGATSRRRRAVIATTAVAGLMATLVISALVQTPILGRFQPLPGGGGVNLYLGNKRGADGMVPRQDRHQSYGDTYRDSVQLFAYAVYQEETGDQTTPPNPAAVSRFWVTRTFEEISQAPLEWLALMAKKTVLLSWNREIPNNKSFAFIVSEESRLLGWLPVRFWLLFALAGVGVLVLGGPGRAPPEARSLALWLGLYLTLLGLAIILYFVNARYRLPLWPALAIFAGGGGVALFETAKSWLRPGSTPWLDTPSRRRGAFALALALTTLSLVNWFSIPAITPHRDYFFRSLAHSVKGDYRAALDDAVTSVELEPQDAAGHFQVASMAFKLDLFELAEHHAKRSIALEPEEPRALNQLGVILERRGNMPRAYRAYVRSTEVGPTFSAAWVNAALLELRANALGRAARSVARAEELGDRSVNLQCARAFLEIKRGRTEFGKALLRGAIERDSDLANRLIQEYERPLQLRWGDKTPDDAAPTER